MSFGSHSDVTVIGAGAIGACTALALTKKGLSVLLVEKEQAPALHQSTRNSGVIHAGYNLKPGSLKARFCVDGNRRLRAYCREHGVPLMEGGILIVARTESEHATLLELERRAKANGVAARIVDAREIGEIEPHAEGLAALHAPEGASLDPGAYVRSVVDAVRGARGAVRYGCRVVGIDDRGPGTRGTPRIRTSDGTLESGVVVNCAGLQADRVAGEVSRDLRVVPFRGYYAEIREGRRELVRSHVYAAPDLKFPFLGVHLSRQTDGRVIVGPGAMLAFGREAYRFFGVSPRDLGETLAWPGFWRLFREPKFRRLLFTETNKSLRTRAIWQEARQLVPELRPRDVVRSFAGNRAQLVTRDGRLVDDILVRETEGVVHVLNAVSPGLTASLPFGEDLAERAAAMLR